MRPSSRGRSVASGRLAETLVMATPLILGGLAFAVASRAGLFNIGIEGQMVVGGLCAGLAAVGSRSADLRPSPAGGPGGDDCRRHLGFIPGFLKAQTGAHEVITTIMLNYLAYRISTVVIGQEKSPSRQPRFAGDATRGRQRPTPSSHRGNPVAWRHPDRARGRGRRLVPPLSHRLRLQDPHRRVEPWRGRVRGNLLGADDRAGHAPQWIACRTRRHGRRAWSARSLLQHHPRIGFTSIAVGLVGRNNPFGVVLAGLLFGALASGATKMQNTAGISRDIVYVLLAFVILSVSALAVAQQFRQEKRLAARARGMTRDRAAQDAGDPLVEPPPSRAI